MHDSEFKRPLVIFSHGKESGPQGTKIKYLAKIAEARGAKVLSPDFSDLSDPDQRLRRLLALELPPHDHLVLVGSSMGGYVSTVASRSLKPAGLFLLAPAFYMLGYEHQDPEPASATTVVVIGWNDQVVPVRKVIGFAERFRTDLHVVDSDHRLNDALGQIGAIFDGFLSRSLSSATQLGNHGD